MPDSDNNSSSSEQSKEMKSQDKALAPISSKNSASTILESFPKTNVNIDILMDVKLKLTCQVGESQMYIRDLLSLGQGSVIELRRLIGEHLDILVNGKLLAKGEVVIVNEKFGIRINDILSKEDRIRFLGPQDDE